MPKKEEKKALIRSTLGRIKYLSSKKYGKRTFEESSQTFNDFITNFYGIKQESTKDEILRKLSKVYLNKEEKEKISDLLEDMEYLKYHIINPSKSKVKLFIHKFNEFLRFRLNEVKGNEEKPRFWRLWR